MKHVFLVCILFVVCDSRPARAHDGPDPLAHWIFTAENVRGDSVLARLGPNVRLGPGNRILAGQSSPSLKMTGQQAGLVVEPDHRKMASVLPQRDLSVGGWVAIDEPSSWGGLVGVIQDNGGTERGWLLGYKDDRFCFALASTGSDDGDGKLTYLLSETCFEPGRFYHVAGVYDGETMKIFINGELENTSRDQSGDLLYPIGGSPFVIGRYQDADEFFPMQGRIRELKFYDRAAKDAWVKHDYEHASDLVSLPEFSDDRTQRMVVEPYLQNVTTDAITVMWQTGQAAESIVQYGETSDCESVQQGSKGSLHEVRLTGLRPNTQYFYRVVVDQEDVEMIGETGASTEAIAITSEVNTFQTAPDQEIPFAFAVISDTQANPKVAEQLSSMAWEDRPSFVLHVGDLVDRGGKDDDWRDEFFPGMAPLISRVCLFPVLGNHEDDARNYYDYMSLPDPEYFYSFKYSNAEYFMIDSNRNVDPESEQYRWLEKRLAESDATWKFVCHHHPPYSSDENDYGDLWKTNKSQRGDVRMRDLTKLYDKYGVDIVWNGHIHSYERTWPLKAGQATDAGGTIYMITGGGGGSLETPGPFRSFFENVVARGHHYVMVHLNGKMLELRAYDLEGRVFDSVNWTKSTGRTR